MYVVSLATGRVGRVTQCAPRIYGVHWVTLSRGAAKETNMYVPWLSLLDDKTFNQIHMATMIGFTLSTV